MKLDTNSLAHTKWECKYHIVFAPKYRRQIIYGKIRQDIGQMIRKLCEYKGVEIIEAEWRYYYPTAETAGTCRGAAQTPCCGVLPRQHAGGTAGRQL